MSSNVSKNPKNRPISPAARGLTSSHLRCIQPEKKGQITYHWLTPTADRAASRGSGAPHGPPRCRATPAQGHRRSTCTPGREEGLYVVLRPAQSRPTRPARTWLACSGHSSWRRPPRGWRSAAHTASSTQVACLASGGALLGAKTHPVTPRMLGARVVGVLGRPAGA